MYEQYVLPIVAGLRQSVASTGEIIVADSGARRWSCAVPFRERLSSSVANGGGGKNSALFGFRENSRFHDAAFEFAFSRRLNCFLGAFVTARAHGAQKGERMARIQ